MLRWLIATRCKRIEQTRPPDVNIGNGSDIYMQRWFLIPKNRRFNIFLHRFLQSDEDRALHDHPWWSLSLVLEGIAVEMVQERLGKRTIVVMEGDWRFRPATLAHRIALPPGKTCLTLFITGPIVRQWGFHCPGGWVHNKEFIHRNGCGEN